VAVASLLLAALEFAVAPFELFVAALAMTLAALPAATVAVAVEALAPAVGYPTVRLPIVIVQMGTSKIGLPPRSTHRSRKEQEQQQEQQQQQEQLQPLAPRFEQLAAEAPCRPVQALIGIPVQDARVATAVPPLSLFLAHLPLPQIQLVVVASSQTLAPNPQLFSSDPWMENPDHRLRLQNFPLAALLCPRHRLKINRQEAWTVPVMYWEVQAPSRAQL